MQIYGLKCTYSTKYLFQKSFILKHNVPIYSRQIDLKKRLQFDEIDLG